MHVMAHKELVQAAMFVIDCWSPVLKEMHLPSAKMQSLYKDLIPTPIRVISLLKFPENMCEDATSTSHHLKRFIRDGFWSPDTLSEILHRCRSSNRKMYWSFVCKSRRPCTSSYSPHLFIVVGIAKTIWEFLEGPNWVHINFECKYLGYGCHMKCSYVYKYQFSLNLNAYMHTCMTILH